MFKPYAGVSTAILLFTKTGVGGTDHVWFYDVQADGFSLDDKRSALLAPDKLGPDPEAALSADEHEKNNFPDVLIRWKKREQTEQSNARTAQSFCVSRTDIAATDSYDLSLSRYREVEHEEQKHEAPAEIIRELRRLEGEISEGLVKLEAMLG